MPRGRRGKRAAEKSRAHGSGARAGVESRARGGPRTAAEPRAGRGPRREREPHGGGEPRPPARTGPAGSRRRAVLLAGAAALACGLAALGFSTLRSEPSSDAPPPAGTTARGGPAPASSAASGALPRVDDLSGLDPTVRDAIAQAIAGVERDRGDAAAWGELGIVYHAHRYFALAERCYAVAHELAPEAAEWPYLLGVLAEERGTAERAAELYAAAAARAPHDRAARYRLGNALLVAGRLEDAERAFAALAQAAPAEPWGPLGLGRVAQRRGATEEAVRQLEEALARDPASVQASYLLAGAYRQAGRIEDANRLVQRARDGVKPEGPADPLLDRVRGGVRGLHTLVQAGNQALAAGDPASAERLYLEVLRHDAAHYDALFNLGLLYGRGERFEDSRHMLERAVAARPESSQAHLLLALALASQNRLEEARRELRALLEHEPDHVEARAMLDEMER